MGVEKTQHHKSLLLLSVVAILQLCGCAGFAKPRVEIKSRPDGAEVTTFSGEKLGVTPLELSDELLKKVRNEGRIEIMLSSPGYVQRQLILDAHGDESHDIILSALDEDFFTRKVLTDYSHQINQLTRELLKIHGMLISKKFDAAEKSLNEFQKTFPNIAATYAMQGNMELFKGNRLKARSFFLRARSLDPDDPLVSRILGTEFGIVPPTGGNR